MTASLRKASPAAQTGSPAPFHAPLLHELIGNPDAIDRLAILDLGAASTELLGLLGRCRCCVEIADVAYFGGLEQLNTTERGPALADVAESLLPKRFRDSPVDLVLCWDLPNYLTLQSLAALMQAIARRSRPGALAHALIYYAERDMPQYPGRFIPGLDGELVDRSTQSSAIAAPRYSPEELGNSMGRFVIDRARLLGNGMQEFLFQLAA